MCNNFDWSYPGQTFHHKACTAALHSRAAMLQHTVRRACATSLKRGRLCQRRLPTGQAHPHQCRLRSSGPAAVSDLGVWANVDPSSSIREHSDEAIGAAVEHGARSDAGPEGFLRTRTSTTLGREVARILRSNQDTLQPEVRWGSLFL